PHSHLPASTPVSVDASVRIRTPFAKWRGGGDGFPRQWTGRPEVRSGPLSWVCLPWVDTGVQREQGETMTTLENRPTTDLLVVGAQTDACIRSTLHGAFARGYDATLVSDAHTTEDQTAWGAPPPDQVIAHTNLYWTYQTAPGRTAGTVETKEVDFGGTS